jgi:hypothetical protein
MGCKRYAFDSFFFFYCISCKDMTSRNCWGHREAGFGHKVIWSSAACMLLHIWCEQNHMERNRDLQVSCQCNRWTVVAFPEVLRDVTTVLSSLYSVIRMVDDLNAWTAETPVKNNWRIKCGRVYALVHVMSFSVCMYPSSQGLRFGVQHSTAYMPAISKISKSEYELHPVRFRWGSDDAITVAYLTNHYLTGCLNLLLDPDPIYAKGNRFSE